MTIRGIISTAFVSVEESGASSTVVALGSPIPVDRVILPPTSGPESKRTVYKVIRVSQTETLRYPLCAIR